MTQPSDARLARLMALFDEALDLPTGKRHAWLEEVCADDAELRQDIAALLEAHDRPGGVLDRPPPVGGVAASLGDRVRQAFADRYIIEAELGRGGMATVFLAHERKHDRPVVIKVLLPEIAAAFGPSRFLDEVRIAAQLSHPHILGLIDSGDVDGLLYYVMPHVRGTTLRERLRREGALAAGAAITLLRDIAAALAHAHAAGVVHRDLKPDNILCVGDHAFLMDFGIAQLEAEARLGQRRTDPGAPLGTPGYMAPEQAAGGVVDHRADLYAWGLLGREILTGYPRPVNDLAGRRPDVPDALTRLVETCLQHQPDRRVQRAEELVAALDALLAPISGPVAVPAPRRRRVPVVAGAVSVLAAVVVFWPRGSTGPTDGLAMPVAVAVFRNETGDSTLTAWGRMAGDWITQGLHETGLFRVVPWPSVLAAADHWQRERSAGQNRDGVAVLREETGAGTVVSGAYYLVGDQLRFQVEITGGQPATLLTAPQPVQMPRDSVQVLIQTLRDRVMGALAVLANERLATVPGLAERPPTFEAYRIFDRGLAMYNAQNYREAVVELRRAAALDPGFVAPLVPAAFGAANTGQFALLDSLLTELRARRAELNEYEDLQWQYMDAIRANDGVRALAAARAAVRIAPGSRAGYNAARTAITLNRPGEAVEDLLALDPDRGLMRGWSSYWVQLAHAYHLLGRHRAELAAAREGVARYPDRRVNLVLEARALAALGHLEALDSLLTAVEGLPAETYWSQGAMLVTAGEELMVHQNPADGEQYLRRAVAWYQPRVRGPAPPSGHQFWLGLAHYQLGEFETADRIFRLLERDSPRSLQNRGLVAMGLARRGDGSAAVERLGTPGPNAAGEHAVYRARIAAILGEHDRAISLLAEALGQGVDGWVWVHTSAWHDFAAMRDDPRFGRIVRVEY